MKMHYRDLCGFREGAPYDFSFLFGQSVFTVKRLLFGAIMLLALLGQTSCKDDDDDNKSTLNTVDRAFMDSAAVSDLAEIELGQIAAQKGSSDSVKMYGQMMVQHHSATSNELKSIAGRKGVTLPTALDPRHQMMKQMLQNTPAGPTFDSLYINGQVVDHARTQTNFQNEINNGQDGDVKAFASKNLPAITQHLQLAQTIKSAKNF